MRKKNKKYKSNKVIILLSVVLALLLCAAALITCLIASGNNNTPEADASDAALTVYGSYRPYKAIEIETGREEALGAVFGSAYGQYGGELTLNDDGSFSLYAGVSNSDDSTGTYTIENGCINALYKSGKTAVFTVETNSQNEISITVPMGLYNIYFK